MPSIVDYTSIDQESILKNLETYKNSLPNAQEIKDNLDSSAISTILQLMSGTATWLLYYLNINRQESYLSTAKESESIYRIARMFGYNMSRAISPKIQLKYNDVPTIVLKSGDILGTWNDKNLIYFGNSKVIEKGDLITVYIGTYKSKQGQIAQPIDSKVLLETLTAETQSYVDNSLIRFTIGNREYTITKDLEQYIIFNSLIDFTNSPEQTQIFIKDYELGYGLNSILDGTVYTIEWLENDGQETTLKEKDIQPISTFLVNDILSTGTDPESITNVKINSPFYYSTMRRAVTEKDYTYLCRNHSLVRDANCASDKGVSGIWNISLNSTSVFAGNNYSVSINAYNTYSVKATDNDTTESLLNRLASNMNAGGFVTAVVVGQTTLKITNLEAKMDLTIIGSSHFSPAIVITDNETPLCCSLYIYYIRSGQTRDEDTVIFTDDEKLTYGLYIREFKMTGLTIILIPATQVKYDIGLKLELHDPNIIKDNQTIIEYINKQVREIIESNYEFKIAETFNYYELIAKVAQIEITYNNQLIKPIKSIEPNQPKDYPVKDIVLADSEYLIVPNIDITFES